MRKFYGYRVSKALAPQTTDIKSGAITFRIGNVAALSGGHTRAKAQGCFGDWVLVLFLFRYRRNGIIYNFYMSIFALNCSKVQNFLKSYL